jgi:hypothetical protein
VSALVARWDDFSKGDAGFYLDKRHVGEGYFQGMNAVVYRDGSVGPRSGVLDLVGSSIPAGTIFNLGYVDQSNAGIEHVWLHKGTVLARIKVYESNGLLRTGQAWAATTGAFAALPTSGATDAVNIDARVTAFTLRGDKSYICDWSAGANGTLTALAGSPGGSCIAQYREFLVVAAMVGNVNRIQFSAPGNFNSWPAGNFFDIGGGAVGQAPIRAMRVLRDQLLVWTEMGQLFVITGRLGTNQTVKEFMPGDEVSGPSQPDAVGRTRDGAVMWARREFRGDATSTDALARSALVPVIYTGGQRTERMDQGGWVTDSNANQRAANSFVFGGRNERSAILLGYFDSRALVVRGDAWSKQKIGYNVGGVSTLTVACAGERGELFFFAGADNHLKAYWWESDSAPRKFPGDNAGLTPADSIDCATDAVNAYFATPEFRTINDSNILVDRIDVLLNSYPTADATHNALSVFAQSFDARGAAEVNDDQAFLSGTPADKDDVAGAYVVGGVTVGMTATFDEVAPARLTRKRVSFFPNNKRPAPAVRVLFTGLRGVSVREVLVYGEIVPTSRP